MGFMKEQKNIGSRVLGKIIQIGKGVLLKRLLDMLALNLLLILFVIKLDMFWNIG